MVGPWSIGCLTFRSDHTIAAQRAAGPTLRKTDVEPERRPFKEDSKVSGAPHICIYI